MKKSLFLLLYILLYNFTYNENLINQKPKSQFYEEHQERKTSLKILTWNIQDLGKTKNNLEISFISQILRNYDIIAIQEVVAKDPGGAQAIAKIVSELNRLGSKWAYTISKPTKSPSSYISERYAYIWKTSKFKLLEKATLDTSLENVVEREPYLANFEIKKNKTSLYFINIHAKTHDKKPEMEIAHFKKYPKRLKTDNIIILGDFNLVEKHNVWNPLYKKGFKSAIKNTPTTLKRKCKNGKYTNYPVDNIFYNATKIKVINAGVQDFVGNCSNLLKARMISDHLPVFLEFKIK